MAGGGQTRAGWNTFGGGALAAAGALTVVGAGLWGPDTDEDATPLEKNRATALAAGGAVVSAIGVFYLSRGSAASQLSANAAMGGKEPNGDDAYMACSDAFSAFEGSLGNSIAELRGGLRGVATVASSTADETSAASDEQVKALAKSQSALAGIQAAKASGVTGIDAAESEAQAAVEAARSSLKKVNAAHSQAEALKSTAEEAAKE